MAREKSMRDIDEQYSRIKNRLTRYALDDEISIPAEMKARKNLDAIYDKYQDNLAKANGFGSRVAVNRSRAMSKEARDAYDRKMSYETRAGVQAKSRIGG